MAASIVPIESVGAAGIIGLQSAKPGELVDPASGDWSDAKTIFPPVEIQSLESSRAAVLEFR